MFLICKTKSKVSLKLEPQEQNSFSQHNWEPPQKGRRKVFLHLRLAEILKTNGTGHMTSDRGPLFPGVNGSALPPPPSESCGGTSQRAHVSRVQSLLRSGGSPGHTCRHRLCRDGTWAPAFFKATQEVLTIFERWGLKALKLKKPENEPLN